MSVSLLYFPFTTVILVSNLELGVVLLAKHMAMQVTGALVIDPFRTNGIVEFLHRGVSTSNFQNKCLDQMMHLLLTQFENRQRKDQILVLFFTCLVVRTRIQSVLCMSPKSQGFQARLMKREIPNKILLLQYTLPSTMRLCSF